MARRRTRPPRSVTAKGGKILSKILDDVKVFRTGKGGASPDVNLSRRTDLDLAHTGGSVRPRQGDLREWDWAEDAYGHFRKNDNDVDRITDNLSGWQRRDGRTGFDRQEVLDAKNNVMRDTHLIRDPYDNTLSTRRFDADPEIASAWNRMRTGRATPQDVDLLEHEIAEARYWQANPGAEYRDAHNAANQVSNWEQHYNSGNLPYTREDYTAD